MVGPVIAPSARRTGPRIIPRIGSTVLPTPSVPATPNTPSPSNAGTALYTLLSWAASGQTKADIYLGTSPTPPLVVSKYVGFSYVPTLVGGTTYYWQIVAFNDGGSTAGPIWSFTTPAATSVIITFGGTVVTSRVHYSGCSIRDVLNASPNTASLTVDGTAPTVGQAVEIGLGSLDDDALLFAGEIQSVDPSYLGKNDNPVWPVSLIDHTFTINKRRPFGTWTDESATTIAREWVTRFAPTFTTYGVEEALPTVSINCDGADDFMGCLERLAKAISTSGSVGKSDVTYGKDVKLFLAEDTTDAPDPLNATTPPLNNPPITFSTDLSQIRTRVYGKGHGEQAPCDVAAGETILPIADAVMFGVNGGRAIAGTAAGGAQTELLTYAGVQLGGTGSLVGPGVAPSVAPTIRPFSGTGMSDGVYQWAYTWKTAAGETAPSPLTTKTMETLPSAPPISTIETEVLLGGPAAGVTITYAVAIIKDIALALSVGLSSGVSDLGATMSVVAAGGTWYRPTFISTASTEGRYVGLFRFDSTGTTWYLMGYILCGVGVGNPASVIEDGSVHNYNSAFSSTFVIAPWTPFTDIHRASVANVPIGPIGTTQRKVYRTAAGASQLMLQQTIANNTATTGVNDTTADASLGANAPTGDTSGLSTVVGQVNAGSTSMLTASVAPFPPDGGWVMIGSQFIRYTSVSGNTLTGILATGAGSIQTTIPDGNTVIAAPALIGVNSSNGLVRAMAKGSTIAIWVERNDLTAQAALGALELDADGNVTDGIREYQLIDDRRGEDSLTAACDAELAIFSRPIVATSYHTRDPKTKSGKTISIDLQPEVFDSAVFDQAVFNASRAWLSGDFVIQDVTITFDGSGLNPQYAVQASTARYTLADLLRRVVIAS